MLMAGDLRGRTTPAMSPRRGPFTVVDATRWSAAPGATVLAAWLDAFIARRWLFATASAPLSDAVIEPRPGGIVRLVTATGDVVVGRVEAIDRPAGLRFALTAGPRVAATSVTVTLRPAGGGTALAVRHADVRATSAGWLEGRWTGMLYGLAESLGCDSDDMPCQLEPR